MKLILQYNGLLEKLLKLNLSGFGLHACEKKFVSTFNNVDRTMIKYVNKIRLPGPKKKIDEETVTNVPTFIG